MDFAEKEGKSFLVMVDSQSKWVEVKLMTSTTAQKTVEVVRSVFASYGQIANVVSAPTRASLAAASAYSAV